VVGGPATQIWGWVDAGPTAAPGKWAAGRSGGDHSPRLAARRRAFRAVPHSVRYLFLSKVAHMTAHLPDALPPAGSNAMLEALGRALGEKARRALEGRLSEVVLEGDQLLSAEEEGVEGIYFPLSCVLCRLVSLPEGTTVKVSLVGSEGMAGISALGEASMSAFRTVVQLPGQALFLPRDEARRSLDLSRLGKILFGYVHLLLRETSLTAACNRAHPARQRLARWLLLIRDRAGRDEFPVTHESLSAMLGVRRESVSTAANELRSAGAIEYRRATVAIKSLSSLRRESCSCYLAVTEGYARFLRNELRQTP
jgi:CRP-like cAMP-binding protein